MTPNIELADLGNIDLARLLRRDQLRHGAQRQIARKLKVEESDVSLVVNGKAKGTVGPEKIARIQREIARRLKKSVAEVFPENGPQSEAA